jgi:4-aminobutyrate aminotransferase/(S)-3-amino-2-methylpropionate transaminase
MATNKEIFERKNKNVPRGLSIAHPIVAARASNAEIWDVEGKKYFDFGGGIGVQNFGHCHPKILKAIKDQSEKLIHSAFQVAIYEPYVELAERLNAIAPIAGDKKTVFFNSGAEAAENAVKIARYYTKKSSVISFVGGFHGRTMMAMALTGKILPYKKGFGAMPAGVFHAPYPMEYHGVSVKDSLNGLEKLFKASVDVNDVAAIMLEPVQGEGGFYAAPTEFLKELRAICDKHGILLIVDEVQSGYGRTGKMFAIEHSGVQPDMIATAKSIAAGMPLSALIGRAEVMDAPEPGGIGGTYSGNPISCAVGLAVLDLIKEENLLERSNQVGMKLKAKLNQLAASVEFPFIGEVRGLGAMVAFELVKDRATHEPDADKAKKLTTIALKNGLLILSCGVYANVIRILVPVTITDSQLEEALDILEKSLRELKD